MDAQALENEALSAIEAASTLDELDDLRVRFLGRKSELKLALREVRDRETGMALNAARERLEAAVEDRHAALERAERLDAAESLDVTLPGEAPPLGHLHPLTQIMREVEDIFLGLGYEIVDSPEVETVWNNFDALNQPLTHPSRSPRDTFYVDDNTLLRTHTSTGQIRVMESRQPPIYIAAPGRCVPAGHAEPEDRRRSSTRSRRWPSTATSRSPTSRARSCTSSTRCSATTATCGMRTSFFPFTEPSVEFDVTCFLCEGRGCAFCKHSGWFEMGGAGVVDPAVFTNVGYDPDEWSGFAWGLGLDRIAAQRHGIPDIRMFWENDLRVLRQF